MQYDTITVADNLYLRQLQVEQAPDVFVLVDANREHLQPWLPWVEKTKTVQDSEDFIRLTLQNRQTGETYAYGIFFEDQLVGHMSIMHLSGDKPTEIGYWIIQAAAGQGITTQCVRALTELGLAALNQASIVIRANPDNIASNRVAQKAGYKLTGLTNHEETNEPLNIWTTP